MVSGFSSFNHAQELFRNHEKSEFHREASNGVSAMKNTTIVERMSKEKKKEMQAARIALHKIFETILLLAIEGLPFRGSSQSKSDSTSNFNNIILKIPNLYAF